MTKDNYFRYQSQMILPEIGSEGQANLSKKRVLIVGAGGLGSPVGLYLAGAGIGHLGIVDGDDVEVVNLQRQILFSMEDIGKNKAILAKEHLLSKNPTIEIEAYPYNLNHHNALEIMGSYDVIVDATDNFAAKYLINDAAVKLGLPVVSAAVTGFEGQLSVFWAKEGPCYRCLYPEPPLKNLPNCANSGILGPLVGILGSLQASEVMKLLLPAFHQHRAYKTLLGKLLVLDVATMHMAHVILEKRKNCAVCQALTDNIVLEPEKDVYQTLHVPVEIISAKDLKAMKNMHLIDVREKAQWEIGHLQGAHNIPFSALVSAQDKFTTLEKTERYVLYCQNGLLSLHAARFFIEKGFSFVSHLKGGIQAWEGDLSSALKC